MLKCSGVKSAGQRSLSKAARRKKAVDLKLPIHANTVLFTNNIPMNGMMSSGKNKHI